MPTASPAKRTRTLLKTRGARREVAAIPPEVTSDRESRSDQLLGRLLMSGADSGLYSQAALDRKMRDERKRMPVLEEIGVSDEMVEYLIERQVADLIDAAGLTAIEEIIYRFHVAGMDRRRIATALGIRRGTIDRRLRSVMRKVRAAYDEGIYAGWYEVYLSEVNRPVYRGR